MNFLIGNVERVFQRESEKVVRYSLVWQEGGMVWAPSHFYSNGLLEIKIALPPYCVSVRDDFIALKVFEEVLLDNKVDWILPNKNGWIIDLDALSIMLDALSCTASKSSLPRIIPKIKGKTKIHPSVTWVEDVADDCLKTPTIRFYIFNSDIADEAVVHEAVWHLMHSSIVDRCKSKFESGYFADAAETAFKEINSTAKHKVKSLISEELDGEPLMRQAFSPKNPILELGDLTTTSGENIQRGYMDIFAGAITGIRNPKAHENIEIDANRAIHLLFLASLLMFKLDECQTNFSHPKITKENSDSNT